jgi:hypothetical protein
LQYSMALKPTVFEASSVGVASSTAGAKTYMMVRGPEDRRLITSIPKLLYAWRENRSLRRTRWPRPWTVARNCLELFAQFAGNDKFVSPRGPTPVHR